MGLTDHRAQQEMWVKSKQQRAVLPAAYGEFISQMAKWDWFVTITFRQVPRPEDAIEGIQQWLADIQAASGTPIGWMLAEEYARWSARYHCHLLVTGVRRLRRTFWWSEAFRRFGRSEITPFDPQQAAAFYAAKYAAKQLGFINFGGLLAGRSLHRFVSSPNGQRHWDDSLSLSSAPVPTHGIVAPSAEVVSFHYRKIGRDGRKFQKRRIRNIQRVSDEPGQTVPQNRKLF